MTTKKIDPVDQLAWAIFQRAVMVTAHGKSEAAFIEECWMKSKAFHRERAEHLEGKKATAQDALALERASSLFEVACLAIPPEALVGPFARRCIELAYKYALTVEGFKKEEGSAKP